jgi:two-component system response regulator YesN
MLKTFLVEDEVVIREMIKKMIPWEQYGFELAGDGTAVDIKEQTGSSDH